MTRNLIGRVTYMKGDRQGRVSAVSIRFVAGTHFTEGQAIELERLMRRQSDVTAASITRGSAYWNLLIWLRDKPAHLTDAGMVAISRSFCKVANITIQGEPEPRPT